MSDTKNETSSDNTSVTIDDDVFHYEIEIPATTALIRLHKSSIYEKIENRIEKQLTEEEKERVWELFSTHRDFYGMFPDEAWSHGVRMYGASNRQTYSELFEENVEQAIQDSIDDTMTELWDNIFTATLDDVTQVIMEELESDEDQEENQEEEEEQKTN